jgi:uncharacterized protein (TIGR02302 family)
MTAPVSTLQTKWSLNALAGKIRLHVYLARAVMLVEKLLMTCRVPLFALALFAIAGLFGLPQLLPGLLRVGLLLALLCWFGWTLYQARDRLRSSVQQAVRRVEQESAIPVGALSALADQPANNTTLEAQALWAVALSRLQKYVTHLRWVMPRVDVERFDSRGFSAVLLMAAVAGILISDKSVTTRLSQAFSPWPTTLEGIELTAWVRPPDYTGLPPRQIQLSVGGATEIEAPANSRLVLTATGSEKHFRLIGPKLDNREMSVNRLAEFNVPLAHGAYKLRLGDLRPVSSFKVRITKDGTPVIMFDGKIRTSLTQALDMKYKAQDDYGVTAVFLATVKDKKAVAVPLADPPQGQSISGKAFKDLTPSRYAGEKVALRLVALDAAGNYGVSAPVMMTLPERRFTHAIARQVIAARKQVWADPAKLEKPAARLDAISRAPQAFNDDLTIFAALRRSVWQLRSRQAWNDIDAITDFQWEIALDLEAQKTGKDMAALREKFEKLMSQMQKGGDNQKLMDQMLQEMAQYMASKAMAPDSSGGMMDEMSQAMSAQVLDQLLQELQERMAAGDTEGARRAMEALQSLLENAKFGMGSSGGQGGGQAGNNPLMQALGGAIRQQQQLMTQSRAAGASEGESGAPSEQMQSLSQSQGALASQLQRAQQMAKAAGASSQSLAKAERAMRQAQQALERGDVQSAVRAQAEALSGLASARQEAANQARQQGDGNAQGQLPKGADPLGRQNGGANGPELPLPSASERQRLQQIRALLEERAADPARPESERAYILRLLRRF